MQKKLVNYLAIYTKIGLLSLSCCLVFLGGCGVQRAVYGVPVSEWEQMSPTQQQATKQRFERQQQQYADMREQAEQARQAAEDLEAQCEQATAQDDERCRVMTRRKVGF